MIIEHADTPRFKRIHSELNALLFSASSVAPSTVIIDQGDYENEVQEFFRDNSTPPPSPTEPSATAYTSTTSTYPPEPSVDTDFDEAPLPPCSGYHPTTTITLQESHTIGTSSQTISITTLPSEPEAEVDPPIVQLKKSRPAVRKAVNPESVDTSDTARPPTRSTRASARQVAPPPEQDSHPTAHGSGRKRTKRG